MKSSLSNVRANSEISDPSDVLSCAFYLVGSFYRSCRERCIVYTDCNTVKYEKDAFII